jgi:hypothetical protein
LVPQPADTAPAINEQVSLMPPTAFWLNWVLTWELPSWKLPVG